MRHVIRFGMVSVLVIFLIVGIIQIFSISPALAATINKITATCRYVTVSGETEVNTAYVRVGVYLASDLNKMIAQQTVSTHGHLRAGAAYEAKLDIRSAHLDEGTHIIVAVGESSGVQYLRPAALIGVDCSRDGVVPPTFTPGPTATVDPLLAFPTPTPTDVLHTPSFSSATMSTPAATQIAH